LLVSIKLFFRYVLTFELNSLTTLYSFRTFTRIAGVYAQLVFKKNPIKEEPLLFYAGKKHGSLLMKYRRLRVSARRPLPRTSTLGNRRGNLSAYFCS
jgi:hypothetical protein